MKKNYLPISFWLGSFLWASITNSPEAEEYKVYVTNSYEGTVSVIDSATNTVIQTINVGQNPNGIAVTPGGEYVYVADEYSSGISVIDGLTDTVIDTFDLPTGASNLAVTPDGQYLYAINYNLGVDVVKLPGNTYLTNIPLGTGAQGLCITTNPQGLYVYVTDYNGKVYIIETTTNTVIDVITGLTGNPGSVGVTPDGNYIYVGSVNDSRVTIIATATNTVVNTINPLTNGYHPGGISFTPDGNIAYIPNNDGSFVDVIDTSTATIENGISLQNYSNYTYSLINNAIIPNGLYCYIVDPVLNVVSVVEAATNTLLKTIPVGSGAAGVATAAVPYVPPSPPPSSNLEPVSGLEGASRKNDFGIYFERTNFLQWNGSPSAAVVGYFLSRNGIQIAVLSSSQLSYEDHNRPKNDISTYTVTAFDSTGNVSDSVSVTVATGS